MRLRSLALVLLVAVVRAADGGSSNDASAPPPTDGNQVVLNAPPPAEPVDAQALACKPHQLALQHLALLPSLSPASSPVPPGPQTFLTLSTPSPPPASPADAGLLNRAVTALRDRFWRENYDARLVSPPRLSGTTGGLLGGPGKGGKKKREEVVRRLAEVERLLEEAVEGGCVAVWETRGKLNLFPPAPLAQNLTRGLESYQRAAALTGSPTSHSVVAFFHATAYDELLPRSPAAALTHWTFAALAPGGHQSAEAALGWRSSAGVGVEPSCEASLAWWERAAQRSYATFLSGPPGGRTLPPTPLKLSDLALGAYGLSASAASTGPAAERPAIKAGLARQAGETWADIVEYYEYQADRGGHVYAYQLAKIFYTGSIYNARGGLASGPEGVGLTPYQSFASAQHHFTRVARLLWTSDVPGQTGRQKHAGKPIDRFADARLTEAVFHSAAVLGRMHLRGEVKVRVEGEKEAMEQGGERARERVAKARERERLRLAKLWFERAVEFGEREASNGLGIMYRDGLGVRPDPKTALAHFTQAAGQDLAEAQVNLAKLHLARNEIQLATNYLHQAARSGSPFEAYYHLGLLYAAHARAALAADLRPETCGVAVAHLKQAAERGAWDADFGGAEEADRSWERGETDKAVLGWWMAGERGVESAQNNLAFLLDQDTPAYTLPWRRVVAHNETAKIALNHWTRSAAQGDVDALVKLGDYHYKGLTGEPPQMEKAAGFYQAAAESQVSAMAYFNLGYMYEHGLGVPQDWHLAKRNYDLSLASNPDAALPVNLALVRLHARALWAALTGRSQRGLALFSSPPRRHDDPLRVGLIESVKQGLKGWSLTNDELEEERAGGGGGGGGGGERRAARRDEAGEPVYDAGDWIGTSADDEFFDDEDDEAWIESLLLIFLCLFVAVLSWLRNRWTRQQAEERDRAARQAGAPAPQPAAAAGPQPPLQQAPAPVPPWPPFA